MEINLRKPFMLASVATPLGKGVVMADYLLGGDDQVILFAESAPLGTLTSASVILPPITPGGAWRASPVLRIERTNNNRKGEREFAVITVEDGTSYVSFNPKPPTKLSDTLIRLVDFPRRVKKSAKPKAGVRFQPASANDDASTSSDA